MEMMQSKPSHPVGDSLPILSMDAYGGQWRVETPQGEQWLFLAQANKWTRFAWDVYYSQDASKGWLQVSADLNGDGDFEDPGERSPVIHAATLKTEASGSFNAGDGLDAGQAIPSNLKIGINHDDSISCPSGLFARPRQHPGLRRQRGDAGRTVGSARAAHADGLALLVPATARCADRASPVPATAARPMRREPT